MSGDGNDKNDLNIRIDHAAAQQILMHFNNGANAEEREKILTEAPRDPSLSTPEGQKVLANMQTISEALGNRLKERKK
jgi:hypothetical protein